MKKHFDLIGLASLILLGPLFIFPNDKWNWVIILAVSALFIGRWIIDKKLLSKTPIDAPIGLLLVMALTGVFVVKDIEESAAKLAGLVYGIIIFFILVGVLKTPKRVKSAVILFLIVGLLLAIVGTLGRLDTRKQIFPSIESIMPKLPNINFRLRGAEDGINPNPLGGILLLFIPIGMILIHPLTEKGNKLSHLWSKRLGLIAIIILLIVQMLALYYSSSFGIWSSLVLSLWLMGEWKRTIKIVFGIILLIIALGFSLKLSESKRISNNGIYIRINESFEERASIWNNTMEVVKAHPILGIGMDQLRRTSKFYYGLSHAHNQFLHSVAELGVPGLISYMAILIGVFWMAAEVRKSTLPEWIRLTSRGLRTGIFAFTLFGTVDAVPLGAKPGIFFWISLAIVTSIFLYGRNNGFMAGYEKQVD